MQLPKRTRLSSEVTLVEESVVALGPASKIQTESVNIRAPADCLRAQHDVSLLLLVVCDVASCLRHSSVLILCGASYLVIVVREGLVVGICALLALGCSFCIFGPRHLVLERLKVTVLAVDLCLKSVNLSLGFGTCSLSLFLHNLLGLISDHLQRDAGARFHFG